MKVLQLLVASFARKWRAAIMRADRDAGERGAFMHDALKFWLYALLDGGDDDRGGAADRGCGRCCGTCAE